jgi:hypothetical protein
MLSVSVDARAPGFWGIACLGSGRGEPGGYAFLIDTKRQSGDPASGFGRGRRGRALPLALEVSSIREDWVEIPLQRHSLAIRCRTRGHRGLVRIRAPVDRGRAITATDCRGVSPSVAAVALVVVVTSSAQTDVRLDNVRADAG